MYIANADTVMMHITNTFFSSKQHVLLGRLATFKKRTPSFLKEINFGLCPLCCSKNIFRTKH